MKSSDPYQDPGYLLDEASRHEATSRGAEMIRTKMRLGDRVTWFTRTTVRLGMSGLLKSSEDILAGGERSALYEALAIVREDEAAIARRFRERVVVVDVDKK